jgi:NAD-dependent dihydropyrimidine dehydrogenase PreA subunit
MNPNPIIGMDDRKANIRSCSLDGSAISLCLEAALEVDDEEED